MQEYDNARWIEHFPRSQFDASNLHGIFFTNMILDEKDVEVQMRRLRLEVEADMQHVAHMRAMGQGNVDND